MLKKILLALAALIAVILVVGALQSADYRVERNITVSAAPEIVFAQVNDLHLWQEFSPWARLDPAAKTTFSDPASGMGAHFAWAGNAKIGAGSMIITDSKPGRLVHFRLEFLRPFKDSAETEFVFKPVDRQTEVTWSMTGKKNFVSKVMCLFVSMDRMIGGDFERGLAGLKTLAETAAKK